VIQEVLQNEEDDISSTEIIMNSYGLQDLRRSSAME